MGNSGFNNGFNDGSNSNPQMILIIWEIYKNIRNHSESFQSYDLNFIPQLKYRWMVRFDGISTENHKLFRAVPVFAPVRLSPLQSPLDIIIFIAFESE